MGRCTGAAVFYHFKAYTVRNHKLAQTRLKNNQRLNLEVSWLVLAKKPCNLAQTLFRQKPQDMQAAKWGSRRKLRSITTQAGTGTFASKRACDFESPPQGARYPARRHEVGKSIMTRIPTMSWTAPPFQSESTPHFRPRLNQDLWSGPFARPLIF